MEMWGDAEGAYSIKQSDSLSASLFQITGPEHIPYNDSRWQTLFLHYEQLVHLHNLGTSQSSSSSSTTDEKDDVMMSACRQCAKYSSTSSNLAALSIHCARMIRDLQLSIETYSTNESNTDVDETLNIYGSDYGSSITSEKKNSVKQRISLIGKARVTCGSINLLRVLSHETIVQVCPIEADAVTCHDPKYILSECFTYRSRGEADGNYNNQDGAMEIIASIMSFLSSIGRIIQSGKDNTESILDIPEIYDVIVQIFALQLVLLSTELYQPMVSSAELEIEGQQSSHLFLIKWMQYAHWQRQQNGQENISDESLRNETLLFLHVCLQWLVTRPSPPRRSIASHYVELPNSIAHQMTNMAVASDGMYESHSVVMASIPNGGKKSTSSKAPPLALDLAASSETSSANTGKSTNSSLALTLGTDDTIDLSSPGHVSGGINEWNGPTNLLFHPLRSLLMLSSTFFLLPIRLVRLAFNLLGHSGQYHAIAHGRGRPTDGDKLMFQQIQAHCEKETGWSKTNNILWLTDSPIADLGSAVLLILLNNCRAEGSNGGPQNNPFRAELAALKDTRWEQNEQTVDENSLFATPQNTSEHMTSLSINYDTLFETFGRIVHTEVGALLLYTMLLSSPTLASTIAARSDLDTLIVPLLRSLYFSTVMTPARATTSTKSNQLSSLITLTPSTRPFRSVSQLYVILILLLIFSQDPSFGRDCFRRVTVTTSSLKWFKERQIKESSLGSMILLVLLRAISFNLNRLQDSFLLSNCCAVLLNLSPHVVNAEDYVASRLISVTTSCFKRYVMLLAENRGQIEVEGDLSSLLGMYGETCRTLLQLIRHSIRPKCLKKNIHLVYALLLEQREFQKMCQLNSLGDINPISLLIDQANVILQEKSDGLSAEETLGVLKSHMKQLKSYSIPDGLVSEEDSVASDMSDIGQLTFGYEEEADPEVFFVPYIWDVVVCTLTTTTMEWSRNKIAVFPLNEDVKVIEQPVAVDTTYAGTHEHDHTADVV